MLEASPAATADGIRLKPLDNDLRHHHHDHHQIVIGLSGHAEFEISGESGIVAPLSGCLVPANVEHYYAGIGNNRQLIIDLPDDADSLIGTHQELRQLFDRPAYFSLDDSLKHYLHFLVQELSRPHHCPDHLLVTTLMSSLHARIKLQATPPGVTRIPRRALDLTRLEHFIKSRLAARISVADLARIACLSEAHFGERFRRQTGLTPYQFVMRLRLETARQMIISSDSAMGDIAERTGFANQSAMSHAFRRHFGHSPLHFRRLPE